MLIELVELKHLEIVFLRKVVAGLKVKALVQTRAVMVFIVLNCRTLLALNDVLAPKLPFEEIGGAFRTVPAIRIGPCPARHERHQASIVQQPQTLD